MNRRQQRGISNMALASIVGVIGFFVWAILKVTPFYLDNAQVANALESVKAQPEIATKSNDEIRSFLLNRLGVSGVTRISIDSFKDYAKIERTGEGFKMTVAYQDEARLFSNLYLSVKFEKTIEAP
ncbi:MAG: hypothetical protein BWK79_05680 [Beggiatoa sp. IS2]|nr:MAG: hypothetical protein BWK79_05680 [Beggiatoa sp. IS2]